MTRTGGRLAVLGNSKLNSVLGWMMIAVVGLIGVESILDADWVWAIVAGAVVFLSVLPPLTFRNPLVMLPWEVLALVVLPLLVRAVFFDALLASIAAYFSVAAVALVIAVDLDGFTAVRMTGWFAVIFVVLTTMATAGLWAILRWLSDVFLGTTLLYPSPPPVSPAIETATLEVLMWDFVGATLAGVLAGAVFAAYFRRVLAGRRRLPPTVAESIE